MLKKTAFAASIIIFLACTAIAGVPQIINYQGYLKNTDGTPVSSAVSVTFSIYTAAEGGTALWTGTQSVTPVNGIYSIKLGSSPAFPANLFANDALWLGIKIAGEAEMTPRQQLTTAPYAFRAATADSAETAANAVAIEGQTLANLDSRYVDPAQAPRPSATQIATLRWEQVGGGSGTFPVGEYPVGLAYDGASIWVANSKSNSVTRLDPATGAGLGTYPVGTEPFGIAFDGTNIWVSNFKSHNVTRLSTSGAVLGTYPVGSYPIGVAFDGTSIWVANQGSDTVTRLSKSGSVLGTYTVGDAPHALAFDGTNIWVANSGSDNVTKLSTAGAVLGTYPVGDYPVGVAFDGTNIWVCNYESSNVTKLSTGGTVLGTYPVGYLCGAVAFDGTDIWVVSYGFDNVYRLDTSTGAVLGTYAVGNAPWFGIAFDGANIWVSNALGNSVTKLAKVGNRVGAQTVGTPQLMGGAVGSAQLADTAVTSTKLTNGAVTEGKIADGAVTASKLNINANMRLNDKNIYLRGGTDSNHGLGWFGSGKLFAATNFDGPVLFGYSGGALGTTSGGEKIALKWDTSGTINTPGLVSMGTGTGTAQAPKYPVLLRHVNSTEKTAGSKVALTDIMSLERDGSNGGFRINNTSTVVGYIVSCTAVSSSAATVNKVLKPVPLGVSALYSDSDNIVHLQCLFGDPFNRNHFAQVNIFREPTDFYWIGSVISSFNQ